MTPNRSTAVMQRRAMTAPHELDYFPTPPWATRALCEFLHAELREPTFERYAWEPACGEMHMANPLREYFWQCYATDVYRYSDDGQAVQDFLFDDPIASVDWIITNPPFMLGAQFVSHARALARSGVAMLTRSAFAEGGDRYHAIFRPDVAPAYELVFCERVVMLKGRLIQSGALDPFNLDEHGAPKKATSATAYSWFIWLPGQHDTRKRWIPPGTRQALERPGDYPDYSHLFPEPEGSLL